MLFVFLLLTYFTLCYKLQVHSLHYFILFMVEGHFTVFICQIFFLHSSIDGHLGYFHVLAFVIGTRTVLSIKNDDSLSLAKILSRNNSNILILMNTNFKSMSYLISFLDLDGFLVSFYWFVGKKKMCS